MRKDLIMENYQMLVDENQANNQVLSENIQISMNYRKSKLNANVLVCGGDKKENSIYMAQNNLMQMPSNCSFVCTDTDGELLRNYGQMLKDNGYRIKVINLLEMDKSDCYNPFKYIREETDIVKLITNLIANTTPKDSNPSDLFWEKAASLFLQAIFFYVWLELPLALRNFESVLNLISEAEVSDRGKASTLDLRMKRLQEESPLGENHPAIKNYNIFKIGVCDREQQHIISIYCRLLPLVNKQALSLLSQDNLNLADIGVGVDGDGKTKTALFIIPDKDKSYNFIIDMLFTQVIQELYHQADFNYNGRLPLHVTFFLNNFGNTSFYENLPSILATSSSREISFILFVEEIDQIAALFKDVWIIPCNCDTFIYLGGNTPLTRKFVSSLSGYQVKKSIFSQKLTIAKDEKITLSKNKCLLFVKGYKEVNDNKFKPNNHINFNKTVAGGGVPYVHVPICYR